MTDNTGVATCNPMSGRAVGKALRPLGGTVTASFAGAQSSAFVVAQVALSLVLLVGSGLLIRSFGQLLSVDPGFDTRNLLSMEYRLPRNKYPEPAAQAAFHHFKHEPCVLEKQLRLDSEVSIVLGRGEEAIEERSREELSRHRKVRCECARYFPRTIRRSFLGRLNRGNTEEISRWKKQKSLNWATSCTRRWR